MSMKPEYSTDELVAMLERVLGLEPKPKPKPKAVVDDGEIVRDADVRVSSADPNYRKSDEGVVRVRRSGFVKINMEVWEQQQAAKREARRQRRIIDPARLGHWGPTDDGDDAA
jgi:hypothetical protein